MNYFEIDLNMMVGVNTTYMITNNTVWNSNSTISGYMTTITTEKTAWDAEAQIQDLDTTGATDAQTSKRIAAALETVHVIKGLKGYYLSINDDTNYKFINHSISKLLRCSKTEALTKMRNVHDNAAAINPISLLDNFYVTNADLISQNNAISAFATSQNAKQTVKDVSVLATARLKQHVKVIKATYKKLDPIIAAMAAVEKVFAEGYVQSRIIYKMGKGHGTASLTIEPLKNKTLFANKFEAGYSFTIRNNSNYPIQVGLSKTENGTIDTTPITIPGKSELVIVIPKDAIDMLTRYLCIQNISNMDNAKVTVIMSKGKSQSKASQVEVSGIPK